MVNEVTNLQSAPGNPRSDEAFGPTVSVLFFTERILCDVIITVCL